MRSQAGGVIGAALSGLAWQVGAVAAPLIVARAIDHGILAGDRRTLYLWLLALLAAGLLEVVAGASRHVFAIATARKATHASATRSSRTRSASTPRTATASAPASS